MARQTRNFDFSQAQVWEPCSLARKSKRMNGHRTQLLAIFSPASGKRTSIHHCAFRRLSTCQLGCLPIAATSSNSIGSYVGIHPTCSARSYPIVGIARPPCFSTTPSLMLPNPTPPESPRTPFHGFYRYTWRLGPMLLVILSTYGPG